MHFRLGIALIWFSLLQTQAQQIYQFETNIRSVSFPLENELKMPFAGGINAAQLQEMDLNGDGSEELVIWDINAGMIRAFRKTRDGFLPIPEAAFYFPEDVNAFLILKDFDGDGRKDLFTGSPFGIKAYQNKTDPAGGPFPHWEVAQEFLRLDNGANLTSNILDIPLIEDLDGDGDLDILTFNFASGDYLEFFKNTSVDRKNQADIDGFASANVRWGRFEFCGCGNISFGTTCSGLPITANLQEDKQLRVQHSGGHSLLYRDLNNDGIRDLLIGQDLCESLYYLPNSGTDLEPVFETFATSLPEYGALPNFPIFHSPFLLGENLLISSHSSEISANTGINFANSLYLLSPEADDSPLTTAFLQEDMLDFGENSRPYYSGNSLQGNLYVAANVTEEKEVKGKIFKFGLKGDRLQLQDADFLGLSGTGLREVSYQEYSSASKQTYHVLTGEQVRNNIPEKIMWLSPLASPQEDIPFAIPSFNLRGLDQIFLFHDTITDYLLLARQTGELVLFSIDLSGQPQVEILERDFLGFSDNPVNRNLSVTVSSGERPYLMAVDQRGIIFSARNFLTDPVVSRVGVRTPAGDFAQTRFGRNTWLSFVPGFLDKKPDLIVGGRAGGLEYLTWVAGDNDGMERGLETLVFPNPSRGENINLIVNQEEVTLNIYAASGKLILGGLLLDAEDQNEINLLGVAPGLYILEFTGKNRERRYDKLWVNH
ncbi:Por secretion system C-terminal sorting domain-containing protein [Cyclobacterium lianum]|uniref:Por secretion system C-terminal sorting domain-containing protein n=1 Tax=Cyclobacterium lianum TaxID=388280 RepID=A0A1M7JJY5_9BACT|nr:T9SS type A sorting domain-containing protein [Cyclobacterium lianum]SHM53083.1 Por secretion system C-terminal sorting domain-containing protein [Cyclobacterium lianum]